MELISFSFLRWIAHEHSISSSAFPMIQKDRESMWGVHKLHFVELTIHFHNCMVFFRSGYVLLILNWCVLFHVGYIIGPLSLCQFIFGHHHSRSKASQKTPPPKLKQVGARLVQTLEKNFHKFFPHEDSQCLPCYWYGCLHP